MKFEHLFRGHGCSDCMGLCHRNLRGTELGLFSTLLRVHVKAAFDVGDGLRFFYLPTALSSLPLSTSLGTFNPLYFSLISSFSKKLFFAEHS